MKKFDTVGSLEPQIYI